MPKKAKQKCRKKQNKSAEKTKIKVPKKPKSTINEHIKNIYDEEELKKEDIMRKFGISEFSTKPTNYYYLDMIISVGYRVHSQRGVQFRIWVSSILKEYLKKGFVMDDKRLNELGGGGYFKELLERIHKKIL